MFWITWETQRRNSELSKAFGCKLFVFDLDSKNKLIRYIKAGSKTFCVLLSRPEYIFVQCPSIVLCFLVALLKPIFRYRLIIDAHNAAIRYLNDSNYLLRKISRFPFSFSDFIIVTNQGLIEKIPFDSSKVLVLPDKIPSIGPCKQRPKILSTDKPNIVFISSFAPDEPINEFLKAAKQLSSKYRFFITGNKSKAKNALKYEDSEIVFTDFLSSDDFEALISHSDLNIDLTTEDNLLVCGAYETIAVGVPGLLSDFPVQVKTFTKGFVHTPLDSASMKNTIQYAIKNKTSLKAEVQSFKAEFEEFWNSKFEECKKTIGRDFIC